MSNPPPSNYSTPPSSLQNINPNVITLVLVLSITVIVSITLCVLIRYITHRCSRRTRNNNPNNNSSDPTPTPVIFSSRRVSPSIDDRTLINSLPLFSFNSITNPNNFSSDCAVCLSKFESHDQLRLLPICCHAFHAECVDTWLQSNQTCPLCRSAIFASESEILNKVLLASSGSFRIEIGSISRSRQGSEVGPRSYSIGSFDYIVQDESSEVNVNGISSSSSSSQHVVEVKDEFGAQESQREQQNGLAEEVGGGGGSRMWLRDYVDRLSASFRSSGRFFSGSISRRNENYDVEANRVGEEISELFRWFSAV